MAIKLGQTDIRVETFTPDELISSKTVLESYIGLQKELDDAEKGYYSKLGLPWVRRDREFLISRLKKVGNTVYMLKSEDDYIGCGQTVNCEPGVLNIASVVISKSQRGHGLGKMLMKAIIDDTEGMTLRLNVNVTNPHAVDLYKSCGFITSSMTMWRVSKG